MAGLAACSESPWGPADSGPGPGGERPMAAVVSETKGFHADVPTLPDWKTVISSLTSPGCVLHFRRATGAYASKEYKLVYSDAAKEASKDWWWPLLYSVSAVVTRPTADGGTETLPERVGIRALCLMPKSDQGTEEGMGAVKGILEALGIFELGEGSADASALAPEGEAPSWVLAALGWARNRLSPRPLSAAQGREHVCVTQEANCAIESIDVTVTATPIKISCPAGFDFDWVGVGCSHTGFSPIDPGIGPSPPSGGSSPGGASPPPPSPPPHPRGQPLSLNCGRGDRGSSVQCDISKDEGVAVQSAAWSFTPDASSSRKTTLSGSSESWSGVAVESGSMEVEVTYTEGGGDAEHEKTLSANVVVSGRSWTWPAGQNLGDKRAGLDDCAGWGGTMGITAGRLYGTTCATTYFDREGYDISSGSGPWSKAYFVSATTGDSRAGAYWAYNPVLRQEGPHAYPVRGSRALSGRCSGSVNTYVANIRCTADGAAEEIAFNGLRTETLRHEGDHIGAMITESGNHDVWGEWEGAVGSSDAEVRSAVINTGGTNPAVAAQTAMHRAVAAVDGTYTPMTFDIWWWTGSEWRVSRTRSGH